MCSRACTGNRKRVGTILHQFGYTFSKSFLMFLPLFIYLFICVCVCVCVPEFPMRASSYRTNVRVDLKNARYAGNDMRLCTMDHACRDQLPRKREVVENWMAGVGAKGVSRIRWRGGGLVEYNRKKKGIGGSDGGCSKRNVWPKGRIGKIFKD